MSQSFSITTGIFYPNAKPHIGHALEWVQADFLARYRRLFTTDAVYFQIGLDEHGLKIYRTAVAAETEPQAFVDQQAGIFQDLAKGLNLSEDRFIRTTEPEHYAMAQALWNQCLARGDIYKKTYRAWYNVKQEEFLGSLEEFPDPAAFNIESRFIEKIEEENYFFALSRYGNQLIDLLKSGTYQVLPESRATEMANFAREGMLDVSISRYRGKLPWGVPVPGDPDQVMYVWFDALANYLTGTAEVQAGRIEPGSHWPVELHCVGKDISRFHALMWPAMLLSAGLALPKQLLIHGFVLSGGRAMSKSMGNVVDPEAMLERFGSDGVRWFLLHAIPTTEDGDFTAEKLEAIYTSELANDYGNLVSRVFTMVNKYAAGMVPADSSELPDLTSAVWRAYHAAVERFELHTALQQGYQLITAANRQIEEHKPWLLAKDPAEGEALARLLTSLVEVIRHVTLMFTPALPQATKRVAEELFQAAWSESREWGVLQKGVRVSKESIILFPK